MSVPAPVGLKAALKEMLMTKSGKLGVAILVGLVLLSVAVPFYAPYDVVKKWNDPRAWVDYPECAAPVWYEYIIGKKLPRTLIIEPGDEKHIFKHSQVMGGVYKVIWNIITFKYDYDEFPNLKTGFKLALIINTTQNVLVNITWIRPDGRSIVLFYDMISVTGVTLPVVKEYTSAYPGFQEAAVEFAKRVTGLNETYTKMPQIILFAKVGPYMSHTGKAEVLKGRYKIMIKATTFDLKGDVDVRFVLFGRVYGLAGTDFWGRDLLIAILWGAPVALAFGTLTSVVLAFVHALFGIIAGWFGGKVDEAIQKLTEIFMVIPTFPILILISLLYRISIWAIVGVLVALSPVSGSTLTVRSMTLQIKEEQYVLAAKAYGVSGWRMIFKHILPRILPYIITSIVTSVPYFVFLEAALSFLGLGDPELPTWGKVLSDAHAKRAVYMGWWWWVLIPATGIAITAFAFALLGYALDKIVNPRLREM